MRNITLTLTLFISSLSFAQKQFFENLGVKPIDRIEQNIECSCFDGLDRLTVGYYKFTPNDTFLVFKSWNGNAWVQIGKDLPAYFNPNRNFVKCAYSNIDDIPLYVTANYPYKDKDNISKIKSSLYSLHKSSENTWKSDFFDNKKGESIITDIEIKRDSFLVVYGNFDSTLTPQKQGNYNYNMSIFERFGAGEWTMEPKIQSIIKNSPITLPVTHSNDTTLLIANNNSTVYRYIFPDKLETIIQNSGTKVTYSGVFHLGNRWIITRPNSDSVIYYDGKELIRRKLGRGRVEPALSEDISIVNTSRGVFISEDTKGKSIIWKLDTLKNSLIQIYQRQHNAVLPKSKLLSSKNSIFYIFNFPISFDGSEYKNIVALNPEVGKLVTLFLFHDKNRNYKKDLNEDFINGRIFNRTFGYNLEGNGGIFKDRISKAMNAEYELLPGLNSTECLRLPFTGALILNRNNGTDDTLNFPLQLKLLDLSVKSWGTACARLMDTIPLTVNINVNDCDVKPKDATITIKLDSNTQLISSNPPFNSKSGNTFTYFIKNIKGPKGDIIKLNVLYPFTSYKLNDYPKHYVTMTTALVGDTIEHKDSIIQKMVYSYDPNAKYSIPQGTIISDLKTIRYYIEFQNEGNADARKVTIVDSLDSRIPVYEFQMVGASHPYTVSLKSNVVTWVFDNINLPPKSLNEKGSQGYVIFDAHVISNIGIGDSIRNKAFIYFDLNEPIITNLSIIKRIEDLPKVVESDATFRVFPNPATASFTIENRMNDYQNIKIFNMIGQEIEDIKLEPIASKPVQSISWPKGMYFIRSTKGNKFQKFLVH